LLDAQKYSDALAAAGHVVALSPDSPNGYFFRGLANANQSQYATALPDLQKALDLLKGMKPDDKSLANFEYWVAVSQLNTGAYEAAAATSKDVARLDPLRAPSLAQDAFVVVSNAAIALVNAGKPAESVAQFEQGATIFPASAANFYGQAAFVLLGEKPPDFKKVKIEADKALALDPTNGRALFANAFVANNAGDQKGAIADINKAKASPLYGTDASFAKQVDETSKKLNAAAS
jgi:tetratricopeptide (TPR) repeat protein